MQCQHFRMRCCVMSVAAPAHSVKPSCTPVFRLNKVNIARIHHSLLPIRCTSHEPDAQQQEQRITGLDEKRQIGIRTAPSQCNHGLQAAGSGASAARGRRLVPSQDLQARVAQLKHSMCEVEAQIIAFREAVGE